MANYNPENAARLKHLASLANKNSRALNALDTKYNGAFRSLSVVGNSVKFFTSTDASGDPVATFDWPEEVFLDQSVTSLIDNFAWSAVAYPNSTNPNLDGKTVLVLGIKGDKETNPTVKYSFVSLEKLIDIYTAGDGSININGYTVTVKISQAAGNLLELKADGLFVGSDPTKLDKVTGAGLSNIAIFGASGAIVDSGTPLANLAGLSAGEVFTGATSSTPGVIGYVPAPQAGDESKFLRGDGTWATVSGGSFLDYSASDVGATLNISTNGNFIFGSAGKDKITVTGSYNEIRPGTQGVKTVSLCGSARENLVITEGASVDHYEDNRVYIDGDASNNTVYCRSLGKKFFHVIGDNAQFNYMELTGAGKQEASIVGNGKYNRIKFVGITNGLACFGGNASLNCAELTAGNNTCLVGTSPYQTTADNILFCGAGNDTVFFKGNGLNTVVCGTGNASLVLESRYASAEIQNFSNSDTLCFSGKDKTPATLQGSTVSGSTVKVQAVISESNVNYSIPVTLSGGTATQYHLEFEQNTADSGVYTVSGSQLVKAS